MGQCQAGSLTGAVASERVSEALKGSLRMVGNHSKSANAEEVRKQMSVVGKKGLYHGVLLLLSAYTIR